VQRPQRRHGRPAARLPAAGSRRGPGARPRGASPPAQKRMTKRWALGVLPLQPRAATAAKQAGTSRPDQDTRAGRERECVR
jgi:hypothetical protein